MTLRSAACIVLLTVAGMLLTGCSREPVITTMSREALQRYEEGVTAYEKFYYREALASFNQAVAADSTFALAWGRIAQVHYRNKNEEQAKAAITRALEYSKSVSEREQLYIRMWDRMISYANSAAAATADSLIRLYPHEKEAYLTRGFLYEGERNYKGAIESYRKAIGEDSSFAIAVMSLAYAYQAIGEDELSLQWMKRYVRMAPEAADPRASYADLLLWSGKYDDALAQYKASLEIKPDYWYAFDRIGSIYTMLGRLREAEAEYLKGWEVLPEDSRSAQRPLIVRAAMDMYRGAYEEAERLYLSVLREDSTNWEAAYGLCGAFIRLEKFRDAEHLLQRIHEEYVRRGLDSSPSIAGYHLARARLFTAKGELDSALAACDRALQFAVPRARADVFRQYAEIHLKRDAFEAALDACDETLSGDPNYPPALLLLARVYHARRDAPMTAEIGGRLLELWKDADSDFRDLKELRALLGRRPVPA